ncbi:MAG: hypothetical protein ACTSRW_09260 [Candidatus Helarchaeota archaeon]
MVLYAIIRVTRIFDNSIIFMDYQVIITSVGMGLSIELCGLFFIRGLTREGKSSSTIKEYYFSLALCFFFFTIANLFSIPLLLGVFPVGTPPWELLKNLQGGFAWLGISAIIFSIEALELFEFLHLFKLRKGFVTAIALFLTLLIFFGVENYFIFVLLPLFVIGLLPTIIYFLLTLQQQTDGEIQVKSGIFSLGTFLIVGLATIQPWVISTFLPLVIPWFEFVFQVPYNLFPLSFSLAGYVLIGAFASSIDFGMEIQWVKNTRSFFLIDTKRRKLLYDHKFASDQKQEDGHLMARGLFGISELIKEITEESHDLKIIRKENVNIIIEYGKKFTVALIVEVILTVYKFKLRWYLDDLEKLTEKIEVEEKNDAIITKSASMLVEKHFKLESISKKMERFKP